MRIRRTMIVGLAASMLFLGACGEDGLPGAPGDPGTPAVDTGTLDGTVSNSLSSDLLAGVSVSGGGVSTTTDAQGVYLLTGVPVGAFALTFSMSDYTTETIPTALTAGATVTQNVALAPIAAVVVKTANVTAPAFGAPVTLSATLECFDGRASCSADTWSWAQAHGSGAIPSGSEDAASETYTLASEQAYKDHLFESVLDDDLLIRRGAALSDRMFVHGVNPFSLEEGIEAKFLVTATLANGESASAEAVVTGPNFPYDVAPGLTNVPVDRVAVLHGPMSYSTALGGAGYTWSLIAAAAGSALTSTDIVDDDTQHAYFVPDVAGTYTFEVTDGVVAENIDVIAGTWAGAITGIGPDGKPEAANCVGCHNDVVAPDKFSDWRESGHSHILTSNLNTGSYYGTACIGCHTVGYDPNSDNGGIDEASDFDTWLSSGMFGVPSAANWANTVANYPASAKLANIQCENCHGPNLSSAHMAGQESRISLESDVCGTCHGEPLRHARFQQWQESGHNNQHGLRYGSADTLRPPSDTSAGAGHCGRCHSSQGFRRWIKQDVTANGTGNYIDLSEYIIGEGGERFGVASTVDYQNALVAVGMREQEAVSQTCATCHKVHNPGTFSGEPNDVIMRITAHDKLNLPAGFEASNLGLGGLCIACHNSRNGEHNDFVYDWSPASPDQQPVSFMDSGTPHGSAQGDMLMGENAFFVNVGQRAQHSYIQNACANC
ncbi:MAG: carboxypeptidase-like regulatory domain-containing protein, partial [Deltaproteobacteria bacterium]|nr:carboxypeptidase-like regulatory domain-containing protein [Deltaproteobacteria bacterium]